MTVDQYISKVFNAAYKLEKNKGLPRLATMAQSALENGYGVHTPGNMYFGIKAGSSWTGKKQLLSTTEYLNGKYVTIKDWFRAYNSAEESFADYGEFITKNKRYTTALQYKNDPVKYIAAIKSAGYATDPNYTTKVNAIMKKIAASEVYKKLDKEKDSMKTIDIILIAVFVIFGIVLGYKIFKG